MAQRVNVVLVDDLDGTDADETVTFGLDGAQYEIDLNDDNATRLREALAPFVANARRASGRRGGGRSRGPARSRAAAKAPGSPAEIRAWAREHGWEVNDRGRVSSEVRAAYEAAH